MSKISLGIIGGGQLGSMLAIAAKKLNVKTVIFSDDIDAPAQNFCNQFIAGNYNNNTGVIKTPSPQPFFFRPIKLELYSTFIMTFEDPNIP